VFGRAGSVRAPRIPVPQTALSGRWLREAPSTLVPLAVAVGAVTGLGAVGFRWLITAFTRMFTGHADSSGLGRVASTHWPWLGFWFLSLALCIGGGSVGREGPIVQIGSAAGSTVAQVLRLDTERMRLLVACGAAAGMSATFNAPLAGPFVEADTAADEVLARLSGRGGTGLPVLDPERSELVGWITDESVLAKLRRGDAARRAAAP
jgi:chloride channel protein, CIC family